MIRLAVITTHPIQYYAPVFKLLNQRQQVEIKVFYTLGKIANEIDPGFGQKVNWDTPILEGYSYEFVTNTSKKPGSDHFNGIINPDLLTSVENFNPSALLIYGWSYHSHLKCLRHFKGKVPVIFRGDSTLLDKQGFLKSILRHVFLKWVYGHVDYALYNGTNNKAYFKKYGMKDKQLIFAPHAIDNERFAEQRSAEVEALRSGLNIQESDILLLFAGKLEPKKSPTLLLKAFSTLNNPKVHLLFVGDGELKETIVKDSSSMKNVHFIGFTNQADMPVIYQSCDLFCLPSQGPGETWGLAVNEAMACSKAILVSDKVGCAVDLVEPGYNGLLFKSGDINDLSEKLKNLTSSKHLLKTYGSNSSEHIQNWNFLEIAKAIETVCFAVGDNSPS
ncbi:glycosyltransferase family 4 protein [Mucilaginibacter achroorhodeus]|uniref:glycosyltransferase family 4 protein n=1 Tax=Mucilaginibacter achroorhodeus TaxID=2599294 RepID=UPI001647D03F|nr:glycosyltransferase family 4 protein [Mucilaginibacter achroorhodeus]